MMVTLLAGAAGTPCAWCADEVAVGGVVRDVRGTPLLGAMVQLLGQHAMVMAQTFTDDHGRYSLRTGLAGEYQLRASGAFLLPTTLSHLRLQTGTRAAADMTMLALFEVGTLLPVEKRTGGEPSDDWRWTLRSIANRPLLRLADAPGASGSPGASGPQDGPEPSGEIASRADATPHGQLMLVAGDRRFGNSGSRQELAVRREESGDAVSMLKADLDGAAAATSGTAYVLSAGLQHERGAGGASQILLSYASHPELRAGQSAGVQVLRAATTDRVTLGDTLTIDAGTLLTLEQMAGGAFASAPYVRVSFQASPAIRVEYHLATDKALQRSEDLEGGTLSEEALSDASGHPLLRRGLHQELVAVQSKQNRDVSLAVYRDDLPFEAIQGEGALPLEEAAGLPIIVDPATETLRVSVGGYTSTGVAFALSQAITPMLVAHIEGQLGTALSGDGTMLHLADLGAHLRPSRTAAVAGTLTVHANASGTVLRVHYRWQPASTLTRVDEFDGASVPAFLGFDLRQRLYGGRGVHEVEAVVDANNLLGQGDELALGPEGQAIRLTQAPRSIQGGLAFSF